MKQEPDELDSRILELLGQNARMTGRAMAERLGVPEGTARARVKRLLGAGVLRFTAVTDVDALGQVVGFVGIHADGLQIYEVAQELRAIDEVAFAAVTLGPLDVIAAIRVSTHEELIHVITDRIASIPGVRRTETIHWIQGIKHDYKWGFFEAEVLPLGRKRSTKKRTGSRIRSPVSSGGKKRTRKS